MQTFVSVMLDGELADKSEVAVDSSQAHDRVVVQSYCTLGFLVIRTTISNHISTTHTNTNIVCHSKYSKPSDIMAAFQCSAVVTALDMQDWLV